MQPASSTPRDVPVGVGAGRRRAIRIIGSTAAVLAIAFCIKAIVDAWPQVRRAVDHADVAWLVVALGCSVLAMIGLGLLWWRCLRLFGAVVKPVPAVAWYFGGELGKYLPGGVWTILGRGELAQRGGQIRRSAAYGTTLISYGAMCVGAAVVCGGLAPALASAGNALGWGWALLVLIPLGVAVVHPAIFNHILAAGRRLTGGRLDLGDAPPWPAMLALIAWSIPTWLLMGLAAVSVTAALGFHQHPAQVALAAVAAWIIGFLAIPVPAGAGIREIVFVLLCGLDPGPAAAVAIVARAMLLVVDGIGGVAGLGYVRRTVRARSDHPAPPAATDQD